MARCFSSGGYCRGLARPVSLLSFVCHDSMFLQLLESPSKTRREVEAEPIHVHLADPVAQAVEDEAPGDRVAGGERVARAGVVGVAGPIGRMDVVVIVGQAAEAERGAVGTALGGMVVDDVEDDLETRPVKRLDQVAELVSGPQCVRPAAVGHVRGEERDRLIPPVVDVPTRCREAIEVEHRQQLHRGDAQVDEVGIFSMNPAYVPRKPSSTPEFGCAVKPLTCAS